MEFDQTSDRTSSIEICPVTGLEIMRRPEWTAVRFGDNYRASFCLIGRRIVLSQPVGHITLSGVKASLAVITTLVQRHIANQSFILIEDFSDLDGADFEARRYFINTLKSFDRLAGLIFYGTSPLFKISVKLGKRLYKGQVRIEIAKDHTAAVALAQELVTDPVRAPAVEIAPTPDPESHLYPVRKTDTVITRQDWTVRLNGFGIAFETIGTSILHTISEGYLQTEHVATIGNLREMVLDSVNPKGRFDYIIADVTRVTGGSRRARKRYMQSLKQWNREHPFKLLVFVGVNRFMRTATNLARPLMPFRVHAVDDLESALALVTQDRRQSAGDHPATTLAVGATAQDADRIQPYVEELLGYLGGIDWEHSGLEGDHGIASSHPFFPVYESLHLVKSELDDLIDEKNRAEKELQRVNAELEARVLERTTDIEEANRELRLEIQERKQVAVELRRARISAEKANRAKSEFLANMSHELRTPLNHIIGFTEIVLDQHVGNLNATQSEYLQDVTHSSQHLLSLINEILDLSKVEAGKLVLNLTDVHLPQLLQESLKMVQEEAAAHDIALILDPDQAPANIRADSRKLRQIIYNLLSNAVKFTPDGGQVRVSASLRQGQLAGEHRLQPPKSRGDGPVDGQRDTPLATHGDTFVEIAVRDTGIGIRAEDLTRIFEAFEQVDGSMSRRYQGTGLGLSLTKKLVELHGGRLLAESPGEGQGSVFRCLIP